MADCFSKSFRVRFSDCDYTSRIRLSTLFRFMEECAVLSAEENGYGLRDLLRTGYTLVLSRQKLRITHTPVEGETLRVDCWLKSIEGKVAWMDFSFVDSRGNAIAQATTSWLLISLKDMRAVDFVECPFQLPLVEGREALSERISILEPGEAPQVAYSREARYSDLDLNRHVNNCKYVEWCMDAFTLDELKGKQVRSIQMNYLSQIPFGETTALVRFKDTTHHSMIFGVSAKDPTLVRFQARIGFGS